MHLSFRTSPPYGGRRHSLNIVELNSVTALWKNCIYCIINDSKSGNNWFINKHTHTHKFSCETAQMLNLWNKIKQNKSRGETCTKPKRWGLLGTTRFRRNSAMCIMLPNTWEVTHWTGKTDRPKRNHERGTNGSTFLWHYTIFIQEVFVHTVIYPKSWISDSNISVTQCSMVSSHSITSERTDPHAKP